MKIYTRRGDRGQTDLLGGERVFKDHLRVEAYGMVDELNALIGSAAAASDQDDVRRIARAVQAALLDLGAYLATPDARIREKGGLEGPGPADVDALEQAIDGFDAELEPLARFILPGGTPAAAAFHVARTACRRAERSAVALARSEEIDDTAIRYLNRLSDLLFVIARVENRRAGVPDLEWERGGGGS